MTDISPQKMQELEQKIDAIYKSVEKTRKMFLWTLILAAVTFIIPLIGLMYVIPTYLDTLDYGGLL